MRGARTTCFHLRTLPGCPNARLPLVWYGEEEEGTSSLSPLKQPRRLSRKVSAALKALAKASALVIQNSDTGGCTRVIWHPAEHWLTELDNR
jgi:hypothetical protein